MFLFWNIYSYFYDLGLKVWLPYHELLRDLLGALKIEDGDYILDAGCGTGYLILEILKSNKRDLKIEGVDASSQMLRYAKKRCSRFPNVSIKQADLNKTILYQNEYFDKIVSCNVVYSLNNPEDVFKEFYRVLKKGGILVIANPKPDSEGKLLFQGQIKMLKELTPRRERFSYTALFILLSPISLVIMIMNKIIDKKAKKGELHFLSKEELGNGLKEAGFRDIQFFPAYADQDFLVVTAK